MTSPKLWGIDPGWVNLGLAVLRRPSDQTPDDPRTWTFLVDHTSVLKPKSRERDLERFCSELFLCSDAQEGASLSLERYVAYQGVTTHESENILLLIGALRQAWYTQVKSQAHLFRAIDWKTGLVQLLNKHCGFDNQYPDLKKGFSIQAAKFICPTHEFDTDHEADAICLAAFPALKVLAESRLAAAKTPGPAEIRPLRGRFTPAGG